VFNPEGGERSRATRWLGGGRLSVGPIFSFWVAIAMLSYAFLRDNATSLPTAAGYSWTRLVDLPRQIRFVEFAAIGGLVALLVAGRRVSKTAVMLGSGCLIFSCLAACSYLRQPLVGSLDFARLVYMYLLPVIVFVVARELRWRPAGLSRIVRFIFLWVFASAAVSWLQYLYFHYEVGDDITGLNHDAHVNVGLLIIASLLLLAEGLFLGRRRRILLAVGLAVTAVLPSDLKVLFVSPLLVGVLLLDYSGGSVRRRIGSIRKRTIAAVLVIVMMTGALFAAFVRVDVRSSGRMPAFAERMINDPWSFGPIVAHRNAVSLLLQGTWTPFFGLGPFSYANPISLGQILKGGALSRNVRPELLMNSTESGEDTTVTLTTSLAVELGLPAFLCLAGLYVVILVNTHRCTRSSDNLVRAYGAAMATAMILLFSVTVLTATDLFSTLSFPCPVMIVAGATCRLASDHRALARQARVHAVEAFK
jgi:hypothetical protein